MKVLTAAEMREVDRLTIEMGLPGIILMENAAQSVVEEMVRQFGPMCGHRVAVLCGKGNNGGDGLAIARILAVRHNPASLHVMLTLGATSTKRACWSKLARTSSAVSL